MSAYDIETHKLLARAFERAWHMFVNTRKVPPASRKNIQAAIARSIVEIFKRGERNEVRLAVLALARVDQQERESQSRRPGTARRPRFFRATR